MGGVGDESSQQARVYLEDFERSCVCSCAIG